MAKDDTPAPVAPRENVPSKDRNQRGLVLRSLLPAKDVIAKEVTGKAKGAVFTTARIFGYATDTSTRTKANDDGSFSNIVSVDGIFRQEGGKRFNSITLTQAFGKAVEKRLKVMDVVKIDVKVNLRNTGVAGAPYEWVVVSDLDEVQSDAMAIFLADKKE